MTILKTDRNSQAEGLALMWTFTEFAQLQAQKQSGQNLLALKEVNLHNPVFGKDKKSRDSNVEMIISELTIIKEQAQKMNSI